MSRDDADSGVGSAGEETLRKRKVDHLDLCARADVEYRLQTTLLGEVRFLHQSLPEISLDEVDLSTPLFGKTLASPLCISGMTGGAERARVLRGAARRQAKALPGGGAGTERLLRQG